MPEVFSRCALAAENTNRILPKYIKGGEAEMAAPPLMVV
jgi:hypothetical protein